MSLSATISVFTALCPLIWPLLPNLGEVFAGSASLRRRLRALVWRPGRTLADMPYDVIYALSLHLSVQDLCSLRATSRSLSQLVFDRSIWLVVLRDILEVKPIPRLTYALDTMSGDECMRSAIRLATIDRKIRGISSDTTLTMTRVFDSSSIPVALPGGRYFVTLHDSQRSLMVHDCDAEMLSEGRPLMRACKYPIRDWRVVPISSSELFLAVASMDVNYDHPSGTKITSHVFIYRCDPSQGTFSRLDYFRLRWRVDPCIFLDEKCIMIQFYEGTYAYVRFYEEHIDTPIMKLPPKGFMPLQGSAAVYNRRHLITTHPNALRIFTLPDLKPTAGTRVKGSPVLLLPLWETSTAMDMFPFPFMIPLAPRQDELLCPSKFFVWSGRNMCTASLTRSDGDLTDYAVTWHHIRPEISISRDAEQGSLGMFSGMFAERGRFAAFSLPYRRQSSRGALRFDVTTSVGDIPVTKLSCRTLGASEYCSDLSYDEESGRIFLRFRTCPDGDWQIGIMKF